MSEAERKSSPWPIPGGWVWSTLGDVATVVGGGTPKTDIAEYWEPGEIPWLTPADLSGFDGMRIRAGSRCISQLGLDNSSAKLLPEGTVLFSSRAPIGYVAIADCPIATNQGFRSFIPGGEISPEYLFYYLKGNTHLALERARGTTFKEISGSNAARIPVPVPPKPVQGQIVEFLSTYLTRLKAAEESLDRADLRIDRYRTSVFQAACEGGLVPTEAELARREGRGYEPASELLNRILTERRARWQADELEKLKARGKEPKDDRWKQRYKEPEGPVPSMLAELPEGWAWASVDQLCDVFSGQTPKGIDSHCAEDGEIPFFRVGDMNHPDNLRRMNAADCVLRRQAVQEIGLNVREAGTIIFPKRGGAIATNKKRVLARPSAYDLNTMGLLPHGDIRSYFWWWFQTLDLGALGDGSNVPQINHGDIKPLAVPLPPLAEQRRIAERCETETSRMKAAAAGVERCKRRSGNLKASVLQMAFSGRLVS